MKLELTNDQHQWVDQWLQLWGAWCQTGKIDKAMINMIAKFMATVEPQQASRPVCSDDDGMLIDAVLRHYLKNIDENAWRVVFAYYVCNSSEIRIASWQHAVSKPRVMKTRGGNQYKHPSISTIRREVKETLNAALFCLYQPLQNAFISRDNVNKVAKNVHNVLAFQ
ncbi:antiterminator Q family protein [Enterobacter kobei]|uniref:antiterminator Q family protein n=1 Tax=Enterobacter kobei TaxID=208224 RepID=UPI00292B63FE|nr:antiterminator Q family protein [Enterobacter kobei]MDV1942966.1 antiterminator Q family protein [Enterobacter kobei]